jgi:1,2-diacylglycerol 3-alpha-glucosyltransferase
MNGVRSAWRGYGWNRMTESRATIRVLFSCTGVGIFKRGIESFFREAFDGLKNAPGLEAWLIKGAGAPSDREIPVWCLPRTGRLAPWIGRRFNRSAYAVEQWSSFFPIVRQIRRLRPHIIFYSEANLGFQLFFRRKWIGVPFRLLYSNGGPSNPPFDRTDYVHQVTPFYHVEALKAGEQASKHFMVPYGIRVPQPPDGDPTAKRALRAQLGQPSDRPVILSVGGIGCQQKRMHHLVEELARLPKPRPFLQMLGATDESSREVTDLAERLLGRDNYSARSVPYEQVFDYYRAADLFVLASLREGFGRVYLEAMMHGLPVIAHRHPVMEYVLGNHGVFGDLSQPGELAALLSQQVRRIQDPESTLARWESVRSRFSWPVLAPQYFQMFQEVLVETANPLPVEASSVKFAGQAGLHGSFS